VPKGKRVTTVPTDPVPITMTCHAQVKFLEIVQHETRLLRKYLKMKRAYRIHSLRPFRGHGVDMVDGSLKKFGRIRSKSGNKVEEQTVMIQLVRILEMHPRELSQRSPKTWFGGDFKFVTGLPACQRGEFPDGCTRKRMYHHAS
jgi:hypothetical protein